MPPTHIAIDLVLFIDGIPFCHGVTQNRLRPVHPCGHGAAQDRPATALSQDPAARTRTTFKRAGVAHFARSNSGIRMPAHLLQRDGENTTSRH